jgi:signal transduction histidine kinase
MVGALLAKLRQASRGAGRTDRVSILLPFLIISLGVGALAWRSYYLSEKMEETATTLAGQYAAYAAEITARRVDAAARAEMAKASDQWQQMERRLGNPSFSLLREWILLHDWIVAAVYVPDDDPASSVVVTESLANRPSPKVSLVGEFFTSGGSVKYTYDAKRLLAFVHSSVKQQPLVRTGPKQRAEWTLVQNAPGHGLQKVTDGLVFVAPLSKPLTEFAIRAEVQTTYLGGSGWSNHRLISLLLSFLALCLTGAGAILALRGLQKESETAKLRGALIANVSHELRTPLSMIRLGAETLKRGKLKEHERLQIEDQILREVLLLSHLVENVLDVARIQNKQEKALAFTTVQPRDLIRTLVTTYDSWIHSKGFRVNVQLDDKVGAQMWDRDSVSRALLNLIDNAIKYSQPDREEAKTIDVVLRQTAEYVIIEVRDRGIGIEGSDASHIFEPYFRAKFSDTISRRGAGLGLTLVRQIVEAHGGKVEVDSEAGKGSTFRLMFPSALSAPEEVVAMPRAREAF